MQLYPNELISKILAGMNPASFIAEQPDAKDDDACALIEAQKVFCRAHPVAAH